MPMRKEVVSILRLEVEIPPFLHMHNQKMVKTQENVSQLIKCPSLLGNQSCRIEWY